MPFPFSIHGSVPIPHDVDSLSNRAIIFACIDQVEHEGARVVSRSPRSTMFVTPLFRRPGSNWRFTVPLSGGALEITSEPTGGRRLRYDLSTRRMALVGFVLVAGAFAGVIALHVGPVLGWIGAVFFLWIVGVNYVISVVRAPRWLRQRISEALSDEVYGPRIIDVRASASASGVPNHRPLGGPHDPS